MKKILALLLALMMLMSFAACGEIESNSTDAPTEAPTEPEPTDAPTEPEITDYKMVNDFYMSMGSMQLLAYTDMDGSVYVDMTTAEIIKRGTVDASAWDTISKGLAASGYENLSDFYDGDGMNTSSLSVSFDVENDDESFFSSECYSEAPAEFVAVFEAMVECFKEVTKDLPEYIAVPMEMGEIADSDRAALDAILANLTLPAAADTYAINGIIKDEYFAGALGLASDSGVTSGLNFGPMTMSVAYSLNIVTLEDAANASTVAEDFESNIDWMKWICVQPGNAYIAVKDNQVLCLLGSDDFYNDTVAAIEAAGWTVYSTLANPNV